jgi:hypothetical protein
LVNANGADYAGGEGGGGQESDGFLPDGKRGIEGPDMFWLSALPTVPACATVGNLPVADMEAMHCTSSTIQ